MDMMKRITCLGGMIALIVFFSLLQAQTYVWKDGFPLLTDPDSITFVAPDYSPRVDTVEGADLPTYDITYLTRDYAGRPIWMSARVMLTLTQQHRRKIDRMALYNHYTISRSDECPTGGKFDLQFAALAMGYAVVSADYEGFGATGDRLQAYCYGMANGRAAIDALLAAREWLLRQGYELGDTLVNYGYSQGAQTAMAALRLSQTEYSDRVHFMKTVVGAGPYDLGLTYKAFLQWGRIARPIVLPLFVIAVNELEGLGVSYRDMFKGSLASNIRNWIFSKRFDTDELSSFIGNDSLSYFMQPAFMDSTTAEVQRVLAEVGKQLLTTGWEPDADTDLKMYHSLRDDIVSPSNTLEMYRFFQAKGATRVVLDTTSLTAGHMTSGTTFLYKVAADLQRVGNE